MNIPGNLIDQIAKGNCVLFLGSGPSMAAGLPSWSQLLSQMIVWGEKQGIQFADKPEIERLINDEKFLLAAEELVERLGDAGFHRFMTEMFNHPELKPTEVHLLVAQIPFAAQVTTNYDPLSEKGYEATHNRVPLTFTQTDVAALSAALRSGDFYILKSHGTVERTDTVVLSRKQYRKVMHDNPAYRKFLETLFSTKTVLFIGFGLSDPDLFLTLDELQAAFHGYTGRHYALMDEGRVSEIERSRFLKDYNIEIIPYKPSTRDHPEVTEFLKELLSAVPPLALQHRLGQARKMLDDVDTHYKLVATTENKYIVKEKFPGAATEKPLRFLVELRFDKTEEGQAALESWQKHLDTGEETTIKSPHLSKFIPPEIISRFLPNSFYEMEITIGTGHSETKIPINIIIENTDGKSRSVDNILLEVISRGEKQIILSNKNQHSPWRIEQVMRENQQGLTFSFNPIGFNVKQALDGWRFWEALSKGGEITVELQESGKQIVHTSISPGAYPVPDPRLMDLLEALTLIQRKLPVQFESPSDISFEEAKTILIVAQIVESGTAELNPETIVLDTTIEKSRDLIQRFADNATAPISIYMEEVAPFTILGQQVIVGPMAAARDVYIASEELDDLRKKMESGPGNQPVKVNLLPVQGRPPVAKFPEWLPKHEAMQLRQQPFVRAATLKTLLRLLFDAAKSSGEFDPGEFARLLLDARAQVSDDGEPLNALSSSTTEELAAVLSPLVADLDANLKVCIAAKLIDDSWLSVNEAAILFRIDVDIIRDKVQSPAEPALTITGSDDANEDGNAA